MVDRKDSLKLVSDLDPEKYVIIDAETGTVLSTNIRIVKWPHLIKTQQELITNDNFAKKYALEYGNPLLVRRLPNED